MSVGVSRDCPIFLSTHYSNDSGVVEESNFQRFLLAIMFGNVTQDIYI